MIDEFMQEAIRLSLENVRMGGGPFGAVIVKNQEIISKGVNAVIQNNDPTAHAEMQAIRGACQKLKTINLSVVVFILPVNLALCVLVLSIGLIWIEFIIVILEKMLIRLGLLMI